MTNGLLKLGTVRADGYVFSKHIKHNGGSREIWLKPSSYHRMRVSLAFRGARKRAREKELPFDIDINYLMSIFPSDGICPALHSPMVWGGSVDNSPSLDRKLPDLGYVRGNLAFISNKANTIKSNATTEEIFAVAKYLKG